jgi:hypothetical protein
MNSSFSNTAGWARVSPINRAIKKTKICVWYWLIAEIIWIPVPDDFIGMH